MLYSQSLTAQEEDSIDKRFIRINDRIRAREVRVIDDEGGQIGIMPPFEAIRMARTKNLDLVEISPTAQPPVCRIMDYGKFLYQQEKKEREAKKHQKTITVKEVKFRINVDDHDYETKKNHVLRFLDEGDKVKATIFFRGREMTRTGLGRQILERLIKDVEPQSIVEFRPRQEGNTLHAILAPKKTAAEREKEREKEAKQKAKQEMREKQLQDTRAKQVPDAGEKQILDGREKQIPDAGMRQLQDTRAKQVPDAGEKQILDTREKQMQEKPSQDGREKPMAAGLRPAAEGPAAEQVKAEAAVPVSNTGS
jgi:translation initiation factor IF-3